jgi:ankyrin repeat protein
MEVIMNKYTIVVLFILMGFSAQGMQKMARCTQAGLRASQVVQQTRSKVSLAALAQVHKEMSRASFNYSPLLGAASDLNRTLSRELKESKLAQSFFNQLPEEPVCYTVLPFKPAVSLTPKLLGELIALHTSGNLYKPEFFESEMFKEWHALHNGSHNKKDFKYQVKKQLLSLMQHESDQKKVYEMLLAAVYFKADTADDLRVFLKASEVVMATSDEPSKDKELMEQYADTFLTLTAAKKDVSFLQAEEIREMAGYCSEKALWSVLNLIFYNPEKETLDLTMVPVEIQKSCLPQFVTFIATYSNPKVPKFYQSAYKDFLKLVHGIQEVKYLRGTVEIPGERSETLKILNYLFGTKTTTYQELAKRILSSEQRMITFCEPADKDYGPMKIEVDDTQNNMVFSGTWTFGRGHVGFVFDKKTQDKVSLLREVETLDARVSSPGVLVRFIPGWLHQLINWQSAFVEVVDELLKRNKVTKTELNELSQGLAEKKCTILHTAIEHGREDLAGFFLEQGSDPNIADSNGDTPLSLALQKKNKAMAEALVLAGAQVNAVNSDGWSYLHKAVIHNDFEMVQSLLELKVDVTLNTTDYQKTALEIALDKKNKKIAQLLIEAGADINAHNAQWGWTPLWYAAGDGESASVRFLLELGADPKSKNKDGETALMRTKSREVAELLLAAGALVNEKDASGRTALMRTKSREVAELLLAAGALVDEKDTHDQGALEYALRDIETMEVARALVAAGANINAPNARWGWTPLWYAAGDGESASVRFLLELGADPKSKNKDGQTALMCTKSREVAELLLAAGALVNEKDASGKTALMHVKNKEVVEVLLAAGALVDEKDTHDQGALQYALRDIETMEVARALVAAGANINEFDRDNFWSPLRLAVFHGKIELVRLCLELGADPKSKNRNGETALMLAEKEGHTEIAPLLKDAELAEERGHAEEVQFLKDAELVERSVPALSVAQRVRIAALALRNRFF